MSFKVHVIHDLMYGFNEPTEFADLNLPDVDLVIFNGNIGLNSKRTMLYATELTKKYPNVQFVLNFGWYEMYLGHVPKTPYEFEDNLSVRIQNSDDWPKNLHWKDPRSKEGLTIMLQTGQTIQVWPSFGFPKVRPTPKWKDLWFYLNICTGVLGRDKPEELTEISKELSFKLYSEYPQWATPEWVNKIFATEETNIRNFEIDEKHYKILVTHLNPYKDPRLEGIVATQWNIHIEKCLWVTTNQEKSINFLGGHLYSNPGRGAIARGKVLEVDNI